MGAVKQHALEVAFAENSIACSTYATMQRNTADVTFYFDDEHPVVMSMDELLNLGLWEKARLKLEDSQNLESQPFS